MNTRWVCRSCWRSGTAENERHAKACHESAVKHDQTILKKPVDHDIKGYLPSSLVDGFIPFPAADCDGDLRFGEEAVLAKRQRFQKQAERLFE